MNTKERRAITLVLRAFLALIVIAIFASCGGGGGGGGSQSVGPNAPQDSTEEPAKPIGDGFNLRAIVIKDAQGVPTGVRVTWDRVNDDRAQGYYLYRDDESIPAGDPEGHEGKRVNGGNMIDQPSSGDTVTFDDEFNPEYDTTWYYRVTVVNSTDDESDFSNELNITIVEFSFDSFNPTEGTVNDPVTLYGDNFGVYDSGTDHVYFTKPGSQWIEATVDDWDDEEIDVKVPVGAVTGPIRIQIAGNPSDSDTDFTVLAPVLDDVDPLEDYAEHLDITLTGSRFEDTQGSSAVTFNGVEVDTYQSWSNTQIVVKVPTDATSGLVKVKVGANESGGIDFTVLPHINSLNPTSGNVGDQVTISGTGFGTSQGSSTVTFNGVEASIVSWGNLQVVAQVPETTTGNVVVTVGGNASNGVSFTVIPNITGTDPDRTWEDEEVTVTGTGFGSSQGSSKVYFYNSVEAKSYVSWSATQIVVTVPHDAATGPITVEVGGQTDTSDDDVLIVLPPPNLDDLDQY